MTIANLIDAECLALAKLATDAARHAGVNGFDNLSLIRCDGGLALVCVDVAGECITHGLELPEPAWTPQLETEIERRFRGSLEIAFQQLRGAA